MLAAAAQSHQADEMERLQIPVTGDTQRWTLMSANPKQVYCGRGNAGNTMAAEQRGQA